MAVCRKNVTSGYTDDMRWQVKRIYDEPVASDGYRVLIDRLWPRGVSKEQAACDEWLKAIAPSSELRTWFGHDPEKFEEFSQRYVAELAINPAVMTLQSLARQHEVVTLLYAAKDPAVNHAVVLREYMEAQDA